MSYQVTARKWRPQDFSSVVFQDHVSRILRNSIKKARVSHAYLFSGPRGVGKTSMARILARALNCGQGPTETPCGKCENCREINSGSAFDVIEIDGASNRGIEDIRELRENVNFAPVKAKYKIYIIDEVHMLTREAFNALLKTLEEPPPHVIFIMATTEVHQIPETILSRCQKFFFRKIPAENIVAHLKKISESEGFSISESALYPIARASGGSMRDAQSLLDQVIVFSGGDPDSGAEISEKDTLAILGIVPVESYVRLLAGVAEGDAPALISEIDGAVTAGADLKRYAAGFGDIIRAVRLVRNGINLSGIMGLSASEMSLVTGISGMFNDEEMSLLHRIAAGMMESLRFTENERVNIEMALLDMAALRKRPTVAQIISRLEELRSPHQPQTSGSPAVPAPGKKAGASEPRNAAEILKENFFGEIIDRGDSNA